MPLDYQNKKTLFDVTIFDNHRKYANANEVIDAAKKLFSKFAFQLEECPTTKTRHWQFRGALIDRAYCTQVKKTLIPQFPGNWSLTSATVHSSAASFNYVMKEASRLEGPWTDKDVPKSMTKQLDLFINGGYYQGSYLPPGKLPWHDQIIDAIKDFDMRSIIMVYDKVGNTQKSIFCEYLEYRDLAFLCPPFRGMEDMMQFAFGFEDQTTYVIDMPRGMKKDKLADFYAGVETLKNGVVWDKRYEAKKRRMNRPNIVIYTNTLPAFELMSADRWKILVMQPDKSLMEYTTSEIQALEEANKEEDQPARISTAMLSDLPSSSTTYETEFGTINHPAHCTCMRCMMDTPGIF